MPRSAARERLSPERFRAEFVGGLAEFLELDQADTARFRAHVDRALAAVAAARERWEEAMRVGSEARGVASSRDEGHPRKDRRSSMARCASAWKAFRDAQQAAARGLLEALDERPRHTLLREDALAWLLRLDYGMQAAAR